MSAAGWFCPACQKHHAPHVETCPAPVEVRPIPGVNVWPTTVIPPASPAISPALYPQIVSGGVSFPYDPNIMIWNGGVQ